MRDAEQFLNDYGDDYRRLLKTIRTACDRLRQTMENDIIDSVYTREESSVNGATFKEPGKIANKVRQKGQPLGPNSYLALSDIVGLTIVVKYPDGVTPVVEALRTELSSAHITVGPPEKHENKGGYYATHVVCSGRFGAQRLNCEVQIKSLLHDAWSAKMHDLTYKPSGSLDPKLDALMASVANTIESLERQSILIRDMIKSNWNIEEKARRAARHELFGSLLDYGDTSWPQGVQELREKIEAAAAIIASEPKDGETVAQLTEAVQLCCNDPAQLRYGWIMAGRIASLRALPDLVRFFSAQANAWLDIAPALLSNGRIDDREIRSVPLMYYVIGDLDRAIDYAERLITEPAFACLPELARAKLMFNRATYLVEREYHHPTKNTALRETLRAEIEAILVRPEMSLVAHEEAAVLDTRGMVKITFARTQNEARLGIEDCISARSKSLPDEKQVTDAYADLNLRLGWRRYFELEGA